MVSSKKAISPVVATALLLVVAVVAVVGFQAWFNTYNTSLNSKVEQQGTNSFSVSFLENASGTVNLYLNNRGSTAVTPTSISLKTTSGTSVCPTATSYTALTANTVTAVAMNCTGAIAAGTSYQATIVTSSGVYSETTIAR